MDEEYSEDDNPMIRNDSLERVPPIRSSTNNNSHQNIYVTQKELLEETD